MARLARTRARVGAGILVLAALVTACSQTGRVAVTSTRHVATEAAAADRYGAELVALVEAQETDAYLAAQHAVALYLQAIVPVDPPPAPHPYTGHGPHSQAWWNAIATCESGNTDAPRTGWFGLEAGYPVGGLSYGEQLAWAMRIDAAAGDAAWGCSPVAWAQVPAG